jgi:hypothetical protein
MDTNKHNNDSKSGVLSRDNNPAERSVMHSLMLKAKVISDKDKAEFDHDGKDKRKPRSSKGKGPSLGEKVSGANIKEWVKFILT